MSLTDQTIETKQDFACFKLIDQLTELEKSGTRKLSTADVQSMLNDLCIDLRCSRDELPDGLKRIWRELKEYPCDRSVKTLIDLVERSM